MSNCKARQYSDQMQCVCGLAWDVNDPEPPECKGTPAPTGPVRDRQLDRMDGPREVHITKGCTPGPTTFIDVDERLSWPDDEGQYLRNCMGCGGTFAGGKGRLWCRVCAPASPVETARVAEKTDRHVRNAGVGRRALDKLKEGLKDETHIPDVLYDGYAVYQALGPKARTRTGPENVSDVLDAVVNLLRGRGHD